VTGLIFFADYFVVGHLLSLLFVLDWGRKQLQPQISINSPE